MTQKQQRIIKVVCGSWWKNRLKINPVSWFSKDELDFLNLVLFLKMYFKPFPHIKLWYGLGIQCMSCIDNFIRFFCAFLFYFGALQSQILFTFNILKSVHSIPQKFTFCAPQMKKERKKVSWELKNMTKLFVWTISFNIFFLPKFVCKLFDSHSSRLFSTFPVLKILIKSISEGFSWNT